MLFTRSELADLIGDDNDPSDAAIFAVDPDAEIAALAASVGDGPDAEARRAMVAELRAMMDGGEA